MKTKKLLLINGSILTFTSLILRSITLFFGIYISNKIGSTAIGIFELLMSIYAFFVTFALSGLNLACTRIITDNLATGNLNIIKQTTHKCMLFSCFFGTFSSFMLCLFATFFSKSILHNQVSFIVFYIISISLPFVSMSSSLNGYFLAVRKVFKSAVIQALEQIIKITLIVFLINRFIQTSVDYVIMSLVIGTTISEIISFCMLYILYILLIPEFAYSKSKNQNKKIAYMSKKVLTYTLFFSINIVLIFIIFAQTINILFFKNQNIYPYLILLAPIVIFMYIDTVADAMLKGLDKQTNVMEINIIDLLTTIFLIVFLLPVSGKTGYIAILYISEILNCILSLISLKKENLIIKYNKK